MYVPNETHITGLFRETALDTMIAVLSILTLTRPLILTRFVGKA